MRSVKLAEEFDRTAPGERSISGIARSDGGGDWVFSGKRGLSR
jgi:hypothetical protein